MAERYIEVQAILSYLFLAIKKDPRSERGSQGDILFSKEGINAVDRTSDIRCVHLRQGRKLR